jgi:hypothetical protein
MGATGIATAVADFSLIVWVSDMVRFDAMVRPSFANAYQHGAYTLDAVLVGQMHQGRKVRNMGEAYNIGKRQARPDTIKIYMHQDCGVLDRSLLDKLEVMFSRPYIGAVGILGATIDTGASYFQAPIEKQVGAAHDLRGFRPDTARVKVLDGLLMATTSNAEWGEAYRGAHMAVEDYCMRVRAEGKEIWTVDALVQHLSLGTVDDDYWASVKEFRNRWAGAFENMVPSVGKLRAVHDAIVKPRKGHWGQAWTIGAA